MLLPEIGMKDRVERFAVLPFSIGCASQSSVAVGAPIAPQPKKPISESSQPASGRQKGEERWSSMRLALPKSSFSNGIQKLIRGFKTLSQLVANYKEEAVEEMEMEIGYPTDVKHVTHIGWDGTTTTNPVKGWENLKAPEILSFPSISLKQFELAMAAQAADGPLLAIGSSNHLSG
ncbi:CRIB domain-containing protein RIC4-like isoform X1 [Malania oleifera]|uniref:CRIB domain-containing protein RIC4-like isoform X1 n=1 Tax=Malania oleifera TaxID=397392 RepID=UPI0025AEAC10|nr:CRIB domain-containing protein RIC4-like isoform X1 [Malania oleifera]